MDFILDLWLPILLSAAFVFIASSIIHMALTYHRHDYQRLDHEAEVLEAMRAQGVKPGNYVMPFATSMKECGTPEMLEKYKQGPVGHMTILQNGMPNMGKILFQWFLFTVVVGILIAYMASFTLELGDPFEKVLRLTGTVGFLCYGASEATQSIWKGQRWATTFRFLFDSLVYGLVSGATFAWLWPAAS